MTRAAHVITSLREEKILPHAPLTSADDFDDTLKVDRNLATVGGQFDCDDLPPTQRTEIPRGLSGRASTRNRTILGPIARTRMNFMKGPGAFGKSNRTDAPIPSGLPGGPTNRTRNPALPVAFWNSRVFAPFESRPNPLGRPH